MAQFDSVQYGSAKKILDLIFRSLLIQGNAGPAGKQRVCTGSGAPTDDAEAFDPIQTGTLYYDHTNKDAYVCTVYASKDSFTMVQINVA